MTHFLASALFFGGLIGLAITAPNAFGATSDNTNNGTDHFYQHEYNITIEAENARMAEWLREDVDFLTLRGMSDGIERSMRPIK